MDSHPQRPAALGGGLKNTLITMASAGMTSIRRLREGITGSNLYNDVPRIAGRQKLDANASSKKIAIRDVRRSVRISFKPVYW